MSETLTLAELIQLKVQIEVGLQTLFDVCAGRKRWIMCVPPSPDDPDLLVADGLSAGQKAADALSEMLAVADARDGAAGVDVGGLLSRVVNVVQCARCQGDHTLTFTRLNNPADEYEWWATCPTVRQPVTMRVDVSGEVFLPFSAAAAPYEVHECGLAYDATLPAADAADVAAPPVYEPAMGAGMYFTPAEIAALAGGDDEEEVTHA